MKPMFQILTVHARKLTILLQKHASVLIIEQLEAQFSLSLDISSFCLVMHQIPLVLNTTKVGNTILNSITFNSNQITINNVI